MRHAPPSARFLDLFESKAWASGWRRVHAQARHPSRCWPYRALLDGTRVGPPRQGVLPVFPFRRTPLTCAARGHGALLARL
eukprot:15431218-Alexandrium_andersonii.AAC.1